MREESADTEVFQELESDVRSYCRSYPVKFIKAKNEKLFGENGDEYLDFLCGAGSLNYGHNNDLIKAHLIEYLQNDGVIHGLDMMTQAKEEFIRIFNKYILEPRKLGYKMQFCGPTGTNAVEASLKLAKKVTGRNSIFAFTKGFHGMTSASLEATTNEYYKQDIRHSNYNTIHMPYCGYFGDEVSSIRMIEKYLSDPSSGYEKPAAILLETVQGEGGLNVASDSWLQQIEKLCKKHEIILIIDDIQAGCGRCGSFFSFEKSGIKPDITLLSKSISGYGLPMSLVLLKPELDEWKPAEHNGTFRGNNLAFVGATKMVEYYWKDQKFEIEISKKSQIIAEYIDKISNVNDNFSVKGRGMMLGISSKDKALPSKIKANCFKKNLIIETSGAYDEVLKIFPPLTISEENLRAGLDIVVDVINDLENN